MGEIRFVGTGETRGYPYLVCKKNIPNHLKSKVRIPISLCRCAIRFLEYGLYSHSFKVPFNVIP